MQEVWKPVTGYENSYEISNSGNVRSIGRYVILRNSSLRYVREKTLRPKNTGGYLFVALSKNGERKDHYIHRLVAQAFLPKYPGRNYVNHKDGNPSNNVVANLEWVTHSENVWHAYRTGLYKTKGKIGRRTEEMERKNYQDFQIFSNEFNYNRANR